MKKLVVLTLAIATAIVASASSVSWKFNAGNTYAGYNVYIVSAITEGGFTGLSDIQSNLLGTGGNTGTLAAGRTAATATDAVAGLTDAAGSTVNFYYVIVNPNDATGYWTVAGSGEAYTTAATHTDSVIATSAGNSALSANKTAWATGGGGGGQGGETVPEPTSGLLLLVGGALLGLRRKQK